MPDYNKVVQDNNIELENLLKEVDSLPVVYEWAQAKQKPTYTADEVGALSKDTQLPETAYQTAEKGGYLKTEDQFAKDLANISNFTLFKLNNGDTPISINLIIEE